MSQTYKKFLRLLDKWPIDPTKTGRDLGEHIRVKIAQGFRQGETSVVNERECEKTYASLSRIASNYYGDKYKRRFESSASGLSADDCRRIISNDGLKEVENIYASRLEKMKMFFKRKQTDAT
uniref:Mitochondrial nucleoid factor 1 n=1 Tax=Strigamia maritima TaxID=126957 RepID=T1JKJ4_STRMM